MTDNRQPNALIVSSSIGTISGFLDRHLIAMEADGWTVTVAAGFNSTRRPSSATVTVEELPFPRSWPRPSVFLKLLRSTRSLVTDVRPDVVEVHTPIAAAIVRIACFRTVPVVYFVHGLHFHSGQHTRRMAHRFAETVLSHVTSAHIAINEEDHLWLSRRWRATVYRVPGVGIEIDHFKNTAAPTPKSRRRPPTIAVIGELNTEKHPLLALKAAALVPGATVVFAGEGPLRAELELLAQQLNIEDRTEILGRIDDVRPLLARSDVLLFCSEREGLPRTVMEAMATNLPVVAAPIRGNIDLLEGWAGFLPITSRTPEDVAASVHSALALDREILTGPQALQEFSLSSSINRHMIVLDKFRGPKSV